jgi:transposase
VVPGSFEHALNEIVEEHLDMSVFEERYRNAETGARAYDPRVLLKIVLYGYYKGIISSRQLEEACRRNVVFMARSGDTRPHFTTIAGFVRELEREVVELFGGVLLYCEELGLLGKDHFAVEGCKPSSNASKEWSGKWEELRQRQRKLGKMAREIVRRHRERDEREEELGAVESERRRLERYRGKVKRIKEFLASGKKKVGPSGQEQKTNVTDPDSAKMTTPHGVVQGYNGMAMVDDKHQVVVHAEAHGTGQEYDLLMPMVEGTRENFERIGPQDFIYDEQRQTCLCPAGHRLYRSGWEMETADGYRRTRFKAPKTACRRCELRRRCLWYPDRTVQRQVAFFQGEECTGGAAGDRRDAQEVRQCGRANDLPQAVGYGGAGVCEPRGQGDAAVHATGTGQGGHAVEAVHDGAQHREDRQVRGGGVTEMATGRACSTARGPLSRPDGGAALPVGSGRHLRRS